MLPLAVTNMEIEFGRTAPIYRIFSVENAKEFYVDYLGFTLDWDHRFESNIPLYMQVSRGDVDIHLIEHGDCCPGSAALVNMKVLEEFHRENQCQELQIPAAGINQEPWKARSLQVVDPFGNKIRFNEPMAAAPDVS